MVASCDGDALCAARFLKNSIGPGAKIIPAVTGAPSRTAWGGKDTPMRVAPDDSIGGMKIEIGEFDSVFLSNIFSRLSILPKKIVLDVRSLELSEKLGEMRRTVGLFSGRRDRAFQMIYATGRQVDWQIPKPPTLWTDIDLHVRIDAETPGNGKAFAALLKRYANANVSGPNLPKTIQLHEIVPIMHGWDMLVPSAEVRIPK